MRVNLTSRQQQVLWATVRHYIATAEPVGSKALTEEFDFRVSPATIRNAMGVLEKAGLLYQPHTSAGRVPSDSGYRIYVDQLLTPSEELEQQVYTALSQQLGRQTMSLEALLWGAAHLLARLSGYITLITLPQTSTATIRHLQLVQVDPGQIMLIVVTDIYETQSVLIDLQRYANGMAQLSGSTSPAPRYRSLPPFEWDDPEAIEHELKILSNFLNQRWRGQPLTTLSTINPEELDQEFAQYADFLRMLVSHLKSLAHSWTVPPVLVAGVSEVLRQPEFAELEQVQTLMQLLEEHQEQLSPLIFEASEDPLPGSRVTVRIGAENPLESIRTCALVSSTYYRGLTPVGSVTVLGPTRMVYETAIAAVEAGANYLSESLR
uniref:HrcA family transcriptional regulator n=1 Tax=Trichothermofontia sichuanensis TaxID=3045816 RepID=UPI00249D8DEB|nr:heat-inducible transcriptional repressor HrcA [Trichothermofontia sichuanensis]